MLRLGRREFGPHEPVIMAIVNRTPDSFYDQGATFRDEPALARVEQAVADGAAIIDIGGGEGEAGGAAGADLVSDAWGGVDPGLAEVAARHRVGRVCTHAGGAEPRTRPHR